MSKILEYQHLKRLNHIFNWDNYYIDGYGIFLFILGIFHPWVFILCMIYFYLVRKRLKLPFVLFFVILIYVLYLIISQRSIPQSIQGEARVKNVDIHMYSSTVTIEYKNMKFNMKSQLDTYHEGDVIYLDATVKKYRADTIPFGFSQKNYYFSKGIQGYLDVKEASYIRSSFSLFTYREKLINDLDKLNSSLYIKSLIFGEKDFSDEQNTLFKDLGLMYLLTISGMHVFMIFLLFDKILFYLSMSSRIKHIIKIVIYLMLLYLNLFSIGVLRLFLMYILQIPNKKYQMMYSKLDLTTFTFLIMLITNIQLIYHLGFLITYLIMNFLYLMEFRYRSYEGYLKKLMISSIIFFVVLPFSRLFSPLMILLLPFIIGIVTGPLFLGSIATLLIPKLDSIMLEMTQFFELLIHYLNHRNVSIHLPSFTILNIFIYYLMIILIFRSNKVFELFSRTLILFLFFLGIIFYSSSIERVVFLDVGQGDTTIIQSSGCVIVVDAFTNSTSYLLNQGIYAIDYLILTHSDYDHTKEAFLMMESINVKKILLSFHDGAYDFYEGDQIYVQSGDQVQCNALTLNILGPIRRYPSSNSNSIVFQTEIDQLTYLFTGDIEEDAERDLVDHFGYHLKSDVLKVAHHGSDTSSSIDFLNHVRPSISIISLGHDNKFNFPNQKVIERLLQYQSIIYRTDIHGSIIYSSFKKKEKWGLLLPF